MWFDPFDNLLGEPLLVWVVIGLIWVGVIWAFNGLPWALTKSGRAARRRHREEHRTRSDPPTEAGGPHSAL